MEYKNTEKIVKGFANHWRLKILNLLRRSARLSLDQIAKELDGNFITISVHLRKMTDAGLVSKTYKGRFVLHSITRRGKDVLTFCKKLK